MEEQNVVEKREGMEFFFARPKRSGESLYCVYLKTKLLQYTELKHFW